jgi:LAO/AO transport system kinase
MLDAVRAGDPLALARAITEIENRSLVGVELSLGAQDLHVRTCTLGVTGPPGAGKSSLINALISELLPSYPHLGVLTVDPSSPVSGGAVLGDRVRMASHSGNRDVFIRSLAARGHLGGVTRTTRAVIDLLAAGGMDLVIVETVGTGQSEVEVAGLADVNLVVCAPGMGDEMQAIKAGILEVADVLVVNKSDLPDADRTANFLRGMLMHRGHDERRVALKVSTLKREGLPELANTIRTRLDDADSAAKCAGTNKEDQRSRMAQDVADLATALFRESSDPQIDELVRKASEGSIARRAAATEALRITAELNVVPYKAASSAEIDI